MVSLRIGVTGGRSARASQAQSSLWVTKTIRQWPIPGPLVASVVLRSLVILPAHVTVLEQ